MRTRVGWKFMKVCSSHDELDDFLDTLRPTSIFKSNLSKCGLCHSDLIEPHKMRAQYLNCISKLCGPKCEARYLVLSCEIPGNKIEIYSTNEHKEREKNSENSEQLEPIEDHLSRKCKKIIDGLIEKNITKAEDILQTLEQNQTKYELSLIPSLGTIKNFVKNKKAYLKNKQLLGNYIGNRTGNLNESFQYLNRDLGDTTCDKTDETVYHNTLEDEIETLQNFIIESKPDKNHILEMFSSKIDQNLLKLEENQNRQSQFTDKYFEEIETRLKENKAKLIKEIEKSYHLFSERINYLKNKFKIENKINNDSSDLEEFRAKKEKLNSKIDHNNSDDFDNLEFMLNEANYINEQLESSLNQVEQNIAKIKRIRYEPNKSLFESGGLLGDLYEEEGNNNKKRKLDF